MLASYLVRGTSLEFIHRLPSCGHDSNFRDRSKGARHAYLPLAAHPNLRHVAPPIAARQCLPRPVEFLRRDAGMRRDGAQQGLIPRDIVKHAGEEVGPSLTISLGGLNNQVQHLSGRVLRWEPTTSI
jgi:hypothetical protein